MKFAPEVPFSRRGDGDNLPAVRRWHVLVWLVVFGFAIAYRVAQR